MLLSVKKAIKDINKSMDEIAYFHSLLEEGSSLDVMLTEIMSDFDYRMKKLLLAVYQDANGENWHDNLISNFKDISLHDDLSTQAKRTIIQLKKQIDGFTVVK